MQKLPYVQIMQFKERDILIFNMSSFLVLILPSLFFYIKKQKQIYILCVQVCVYYAIINYATQKHINDELNKIVKYPLLFCNAHIFNTLIECIRLKFIDIKFAKFVAFCSLVLSVFNTIIPMLEPYDTSTQLSHKNYENCLFSVIISFFLAEVLGFVSFSIERFLETLLSKILKPIILSLLYL